MSAARNDGGPAFPVLESGGAGLELTCTGMSLRDYFAGKALQGLLAGGARCEGGLARARLTDEAYGHADSMLISRGTS